MTVNEATAAAAALCGAVFDSSVLRRWLSELDGVVAETGLRQPAPEPYGEGEAEGERTLLIPPPWDGGVYTHYLETLCYYSNGEYARAENARVLFETALRDYGKARVRKGPPPAPGRLKI